MDHHELNIYPISEVHSDIIRTHILTRLDGFTLAATSSTTSQLRDLSADESLWRNICYREWPSTTHPLVRHVITLFPSRYRSFYAHSSSTLHPSLSSSPLSRPFWLSSTLISAVDIHYRNKNILSKVQETGTKHGLWNGSSFLVELLDHTERWPIFGDSDCRNLSCEFTLQKNLTLSWILIDPTRVKAANLTSVNPISVERNWTTGDLEVTFGTILDNVRERELVECRVVVTCEGWVKEDLHVKQVRLEMEDVEENKVGWVDSLIILHEAMEGGDRRKRGSEIKGYNEFSERKRLRKERKRWRERRRQVIEILTSFVFVLGFWAFVIVPVYLLVSHTFIWMREKLIN